MPSTTPRRSWNMVSNWRSLAAHSRWERKAASGVKRWLSSSLRICHSASRSMSVTRVKVAFSLVIKG